MGVLRQRRCQGLAMARVAYGRFVVGLRALQREILRGAVLGLASGHTLATTPGIDTCGIGDHSVRDSSSKISSNT